MPGAGILFRSAAPAFAVVAQGLVVLGMIGASAVFPPARGAMLLVPLPGIRADTVINLALSHGARIAGLGKVSGSIVVVGDRGLLLPALARKGVLVLAAAPALCGARPDEAA